MPLPTHSPSSQIFQPKALRTLLITVSALILPLLSSCIVVTPNQGNKAPAGIHNPPVQRYGERNQEISNNNQQRQVNPGYRRQDQPLQSNIIPSNNNALNQQPIVEDQRDLLGRQNQQAPQRRNQGTTQVDPNQPLDPRQPSLSNSSSNNLPDPTLDPLKQSTTQDTGSTPLPSTSSSSAEQYPYATPVAGQAGMVISPYAKDKGWVDVSGIPPGTKVTDPYTGKVFLVP